MEQFLIGNILVQLDYAGVPVIREGNLQRFRHDGAWDGDLVRLNCAIERPPVEQSRLLRKDNRVYEIYSCQDQTFLLYHWGNRFHGFAVWPHRFAVTFPPEMMEQTPLREDWFFSICAFHRQLLLRDGCVLHASYVDIGGEAILFTGPSNIGKSTQADLWVRHCGAEIINGDRAVLRKRNGKWHVFGYPCCGTSGICVNRDMPLKAIVVLAQSKENTVEPLSAANRIRALVSATELYPWDHGEIDMAFGIAGDIAQSVPVVKLSCRPDRGAVDVLKEYLEESNL